MQVMHDDDNNITICTALYQSSGFFIIMSPAEGLHFSALVTSGLILTIHIIIPLHGHILYTHKEHCITIFRMLSPNRNDITTQKMYKDESLESDTDEKRASLNCLLKKYIRKKNLL